LAQNDYENAAKKLLGDQGNRIDWSAVSRLMSGKEGKALLQALAGSGGDALKQSAGSALQGDRDAAGRMMASLLSTREGTDLVQKLVKLMKT